MGTVSAADLAFLGYSQFRSRVGAEAERSYDYSGPDHSGLVATEAVAWLPGLYDDCAQEICFHIWWSSVVHLHIWTLRIKG